MSHHAIGHTKTHGDFGGRACDTRAAVGHAFSHLEFHIVVEITDRTHAGTLVDRLLDLLGNADVLHDEGTELESVFLLQDRVQQGQQRVAQDQLHDGHQQGRRRSSTEEIVLGSGFAVPRRAVELLRDELYAVEQTLDVGRLFAGLHGATHRTTI